MRLLTYNAEESFRLGVLLEKDWVVDLASAYTAHQQSGKGNTQPSLTTFPADMLTFLENDSHVWEIARSVIAWIDQTGGGMSTFDFAYPLSRLRLAPPVPNPTKIICVGLNYHDHCREQSVDVPTHPVIFAKFPSALIGPQEYITWDPDDSNQVDYEAELAVVLKKRARNVSRHDAEEYIAGYTILNDVSARDVQFEDGQWIRGKSFDTFCPLGPYLVTPDEVGNPHELAIQCRLNGELVQDSSTRELIFGIPELIEFISKTCTLLPGDIITTGTPDGVGVFRHPPVFLQSGDAIEVSIDKIGTLRNQVVL